MDVQNIIEKLGLLPHPEGGWFRETYRSDEQVQKSALPDRFTDNRHLSTAIFFLIEKNNFSAFHRIKSDEVWHFYHGDPLIIHMLLPNGSLESVRLGNKLHADEHLQYVVPANVWFASEPAADSSFSLVGCTVSPGFNFEDFEMGGRQQLIHDFPQHQDIIERLTRQ